MQMDQPMGAVTAIAEMLMHERGGVLHIFPAVPPSWPDVGFRGLHAPGGLTIDATREAGQVTQVTIHAHRDATFRLADPWQPGKVHDYQLPAGGCLELAGS
jgi:alpha-L-fucosidase 2